MDKLPASFSVQRPLQEFELHEARVSRAADFESTTDDNLRNELTGRSIKELFDLLRENPDDRLEVYCDERVFENCGITGTHYLPLLHAGRSYRLHAMDEGVLSLCVDERHTVVIDTDNASFFRLAPDSLELFKKRKSESGKNVKEEGPGSVRKTVAAALRLQLCDTREPAYATLKGNVDLSEHTNRMALSAFMSTHPDIPLYAVVKNSEFYDDANLNHLKGNPSSTQYELEIIDGSTFMRIPRGEQMTEDRRIDLHMFGRCLCLSEASLARMHSAFKNE